MTRNQLELDGICIEILRKPIKNMYLRVNAEDGKVSVSAPLKLRLDLIQKQLASKSSWIHQQLTRFNSRPLSPASSYETGEKHFFLGKGYPLLIHQTKERMRVRFEDQIFHCYVIPDLTVAEKQKLLENWYRQQMKALIPSLLAKWEPIIGESVNSWGIKVMKTRWGSCNPQKRRIWLNLNLIKKDPSCLEYVLVHELVHLLEASHNRRFYALMDKFLPQWRSIKTLL